MSQEATENQTEAKAKHIYDWEAFWKEFTKRIQGFWQPILVFYFFIVVVGVGSSGVWVPFITEHICDPNEIKKTLTIGAATYCIALLAGAMADNILFPEKNKTIRFFIFCLFLSSFSLSYVTLINNSLYVAGAAVLITYLIWILNYSLDDSKRENIVIDGETPKGGSTEQKLKGSLGGLKH